MELVKWHSNICPKRCYLVAFDSGRSSYVTPNVRKGSMNLDYEYYFIIRPKQ